MIKIGSKPETNNLEDKSEPEEDEGFIAESQSTEESSQAEYDSEGSLAIALGRDASELSVLVEDDKSDEVKKKVIDEKLNEI